jgi:hypothetical protein
LVSDHVAESGETDRERTLRLVATEIPATAESAQRRPARYGHEAAMRMAAIHKRHAEFLADFARWAHRFGREDEAARAERRREEQLRLAARAAQRAKTYRELGIG